MWEENERGGKTDAMAPVPQLWGFELHGISNFLNYFHLVSVSMSKAPEMSKIQTNTESPSILQAKYRSFLYS